MIGDERRDLFVCLPSHTLEHWKLNIHTLQKYLKSNKDDSLHLAWKYTCIFVLGHHCSSELTVFLKLHSFRTVYIPEQVMSADKYLCIFSVRIEAISTKWIGYTYLLHPFWNHLWSVQFDWLSLVWFIHILHYFML